MANSDTEWESIGRSEPYWGVANFERYKRKNLTSALIQEFFNSGEEYVKEIFDIISSHLDRNFNPSLGIDFGCGVGRIAIPLSKRCKHVIGIDVSPSMIAEAKRNCISFNATNISFVDDLSKIKQNADFVNTAHVLQHIETKRGMQLIEDLIGKLNPSGIACIHVPYALDRSKMSRTKKTLHLAFRSIVYKSSLAQKLYKLIVKKDANAPFMLMNDYNINTILTMLSKKNPNEIFILTKKSIDRSIDACIHSAFLFIKK